MPQFWLATPEVGFYMHRSLSILVVVLNGIVLLRVLYEKIERVFIYRILGLVGLEIMLGIAMYYFDFPFATQPIHLLTATILFGVQLYWILRIYLHRYDLSL